MHTLISKLQQMRDSGGTVRTRGLDDATIERCAQQFPQLEQAIKDAHAAFQKFGSELPDLLKMDESAQLQQTQSDFINFYPDDAINPYVALAARGPWVVTLKGAVLHDSGGYGMLGFGHAPEHVLKAMGRPHVMANIMTPSVSHLRFSAALKRELGHTRGGSPFSKFLCLNSGSEAVTLAGRLVDVNVKLMTDPGARHAGKSVRRLAIKGAFHGRTEQPARYSDSSRKAYAKYLGSYRNDNSLITVEPYNVEQLRTAFAEADKNGWFIEAMYLEPVMGEGDPGRAVTPEFYAAARELTCAHGSLFLVDSIQAGLRAHGVLSIVDYPGFEKFDAPDMETYSKALNAGQYPLSVLAVTPRTAELYRKGIYGNTMTTNPRAMDVACAVMEQLTPALRNNITERGREFVEKLNALKNELGGMITKVQGTGLLLSCELMPEFKCYGADSTEEYMREHGFGVIHGGVNSLRFTPHFGITSAEIDLIVGGIRQALISGPRMIEVAEAVAA